MMNIFHFFSLLLLKFTRISSAKRVHIGQKRVHIGHFRIC